MTSIERLKEARILRRMARCRHFTGVQHDQCGKGIAYHTVQGPRGGIACLPQHFSPSPCPACSHYEGRTREEVEQEEREHQANIDKICSGISLCCDATLKIFSTSRSEDAVCSKCGRLAYHASKRP